MHLHDCTRGYFLFISIGDHSLQLQESTHRFGSDVIKMALLLKKHNMIIWFY